MKSFSFKLKTRAQLLYYCISFLDALPKIPLFRILKTPIIALDIINVKFLCMLAYGRWRQKQFGGANKISPNINTFQIS